MPFTDYYTILGVSTNASGVQIRRAYHRLARLYHPDVNKKEGHDARMRLVNEAYEILSDATRRATYDALLMEERRAATLRELVRRQQEAARREPKMTWTEGLVGFVRELKKEIRD